MSEYAYTTGSQFPPLTEGLVRLYSMRFCPYSQRVRLVLAAKKVKYETVNVNTKRKPEWYLEINPIGTVPCLQYKDDTVITDSLIISEYLDAIYPQENKLYPSDAYVKAKNQMLIESFQRVAALLYKGLKFKDAEAFNEINKILDSFEKTLTEEYFGGKVVGITDYMIWPWFERFESLKSLTNYQIDKERFPKLSKWINRMLKLSAVKETKMPEDQMVEFYKTSLTNEPDFDVGLPKREEPKPETTETTE